MRLPFVLIGRLAIIIVLVTTFFSCCKDEDFPETFDHFIFGLYFCECSGKCAIVYRLTEETLEYSTEISCATGNHLFPDSLLTAEQFQIAQKLIDEFPDKLLEESENIYGCPDCRDQGGFYLELQFSGTTRTWNVDTDDDDLPEFIHEYTDLIREVMLDLQ